MQPAIMCDVAPEWHGHLNAGRRAKFQLSIFSYTILVELAN
jgi:hypothetical protein